MVFLTYSSFFQFNRPLAKGSHGPGALDWLCFLPMSSLCRFGKKIKNEFFSAGEAFFLIFDIFKNLLDVSGAAGAFAPPGAVSESSAGVKAPPEAGSESLAGAFAPPLSFVKLKVSSIFGENGEKSN